MRRVITYIDGFNLYFGMKSEGWRRYYWLNVCELASSLLKPDQTLAHTKYFTARISGPPDKRTRQTTYIEALETLPDLSIFYGHYQFNDRTCRHCSHTDRISSEKMTDVNIAVELMTDAFQDAFETAILVSGDSDLVGPVAAVRRLFPDKRVVVAFPPRRVSAALRSIADASFTIGRAQLARSLFTEQVSRADGFSLTRPVEWR